MVDIVMINLGVCRRRLIKDSQPTCITNWPMLERDLFGIVRTVKQNYKQKVGEQKTNETRERKREIRDGVGQ